MVSRVGNFMDSIASGIVGGVIVIALQEFGAELKLGVGFLLLLGAAIIILFHNLITCRKQ